VKPRHHSRMLATQFLFQRDLNNDDFEEALATFWLERKHSGKVRQFAEKLIRGVDGSREEIDKRLEEYAENWDIKRMSVVDRNILRMALYEMFFCLDIPPIVSINEAVDITKEFSGVKSGHFVNGILDRAKRDLSRPLRTVKPVNWDGTCDDKKL